MVVDPRKLAGDDPNKLTTGRGLHADQLFDRESIADVVDQRRSVVQPVRIRNDLRPSRLLATLVEAAVKVANFHITVENLFAVELEIELDGSMGGRMGWPHLQLHDFGR